MLSFEDQYHNSPHAACYQRYLRQILLGIKRYLQDQQDQNTVSTRMEQHKCSEFSLNCALDDVIRLRSVAAPLIPTRCPSSDLCPNLQSNENSLEQCLMGIFELQCPLKLSDQAFKTSMSICVTTCLFSPSNIPTMLTMMFRQIFSPTIPRMHPDSASSRHSSHKRLTYCIPWMATKAGLPGLLCWTQYCSVRR
jgi:hypothetical protein